MGTTHLVTSMCDGTAARLKTAEFDDAVRVLRNEHGMSTAQLTSMMSESVASRLGDEQFMSAMSKVIGCTGLPCSDKLFSRGSFASRIDIVVDGFCVLVEHCRLNGSDPDDVATMLSNGIRSSTVWFHSSGNDWATSMVMTSKVQWLSTLAHMLIEDKREMN